MTENNSTWWAWITTYRGTGRPDRPVWSDRPVEEADPRAHHDGVCMVGSFPTEAEAQAAVWRAWDEWTREDDRGFVQWA